MMKRSEVIFAIQEASKDGARFLEMINNHRSKCNLFNLVEFFQALPRKQCGQLWTATLSHCQEWAERLDGEKEEQGVSETVLDLLDGVVVLLQSAMATDDPTTPPPLRDVLQILHDILLGPLEGRPDLQNGVSVLCEGWWSREGVDRDGLVPHTLLYVVARSLTDGAITADVKRVWGMRQAFLLLDFEDSSAKPFKAMLLSATLHPLYINTDEGRKFLSFLFGLHPTFVEDLHQTIKYQIPYMTNLLLETYGEVYYRAWRLSSGPYLKQIEEHCLQDLMFSAVHAPRLGQRSLFNSLRKFLEQIHSQRMQKGVSEMLLRLYSPFLWRSLRVANPEVRANAATLMLDSFPLQDPDSTRQEIDGVMQKQFDAMIELLGDPSVVVRVSSVVGVCRVLSYYWEMTPAPVIKTLLGRLVKELAWDVSAVGVRVAVLQGLCLILENRLSHPVMGDLLPLLQSLLHDSSEKVRIAFLELLLLVKGMRMIKFWQICPLEHLLARMETDSVPVVKRIVSLLVDSYQPGHLPHSQQIERCISLLRSSPGAARRFYQLAVSHLSPAEVTRFILAVLSAVVHCVECVGVGVGGSTDSEGESEAESTTTDERQSGIENGGWKEESEDSTQPHLQTEEPLSLSDIPVMCGLLETMVILWEGVRERLDQRGSKGTRRRLEGQVAKSLPLLFNTFKDTQCRSALYLLAANLPKSSISSIAMGTVTALSSLSYPVKSQDHASLLMALTAWGQTSHVIRLANEWLKPELQGDGASEAVSAVSRKRKKGKGQRSKDDDSAHLSPVRQPLLAVEFINWMLSHPVCLQELKGLEEFWKLSDLLKNSMTLLEKYYLSNSSNRSVGSVPTFPLLHKCLGLYIRLVMHQRAENIEGGGDFPGKIEEVLSWADRVLVPALQETDTRPTTQPSRQSTRKRKVSQDHPPPPTPSQSHSHAHKLTETLLTLCSEILMLGLVTDEEREGLEVGMANFGAKVAETSSTHTLLPPLLKLLYQLTDAATVSEVTGIPSGSGSLTTPTILLQGVLSLLTRVSETKPETLGKCLGHVRGCLGSVVVESVRVGSLSSVSCDLLPTIEVIVETVMRAEVNHIKTPGAVIPESLDELPPLVSCLVKQCCGNKVSTSVFLAHLDAHLSAVKLQTPELLLTHQASLCIISALVRGKHKSMCSKMVAVMRCLRQSLKIVQNCSEEDQQKWSSPLAILSSLTQSVQDTILYKT